MEKSSIIFFGTPEFSATILKGLITAGYNIVAVITQPDQPVGRRQIPTPSPVKLLAQKHKIPVLTPKTLNNNFQFSIFNFQLGILAAYAKLIPPKLLSIPKYGFLNIHPSLLPKYRGSSPIETAILNGEKETGVTIIQMDEKVDHGPIISQAKIPISPTDTKTSLTQKLAVLGGDLLIANLYVSHESHKSYEFFSLPKPQNHQKASYTKILTREDGFIKPEDLQQAISGKSAKKAIEIERQIRAFDPWPGTWSWVAIPDKKPVIRNHREKTESRKNLRGSVPAKPFSDSVLQENHPIKRLKILKAHLRTQHETRNTKHERCDTKPTTYNLQPTTNLVLNLVQLEGKKPVTFEEFKRGYPKFQFV